MSIDLDIFPTSPTKFEWNKLKSKLFELLTTEVRQNIGAISLYELGSNRIIPKEEILSISPPKNSKHYYLSLDVANTIGLSLSKNEPNYVDEFDYLDDYGRNLDAATIQTLAQKWQSLDMHYSVTTHAGRSKYEPSLFIALAAAIAHLCQGYVIVMSDDFTLDIGVYTPAEFKKATMKSSIQRRWK